MANNIRRTIINHVKTTLLRDTNESINMQNISLKLNRNNLAIEMHLPMARHVNPGLIQLDSDCLESVTVNHDGRTNNVIYRINKPKFVNDVIEEIYKNPLTFWKNGDVFENVVQETVLVEFSSPNIAKPFHMGHLRSTIIGNFISNLSSIIGNKVVKINYLGDWGTQFGLLNVGLELGNVTDSQIEQNPITTLYHAYVTANKVAESNPKIHERARVIFKQLEDRSFADIERWEKFRKYTVAELEATYKRLGVTFDEYQWESMFSTKDIKHILESLTECGILNTTSAGHQVAKVSENRNVTLVKSDGSTLYLTRDIAAALFRYNKHKFNKLLYVVDNSQSDHFTSLKHLLTGLGHSWSEQGIKHVKFGRIRGMSTRKGQVVFLKDILDEARDRVVTRQQQSATTRSNLVEDTSDILAVSAVLVNDLKQRRQRDYDFNWDTALQMQGDGGIKLQYTHCRLCSLEENSSVAVATHCSPEYFTEPEALALITELARFDLVLYKSYAELESCILVNYLFSLANLVNQAFKRLQVKDQPENLASQRLLLFKCSRQVLQNGLQILGLNPLTKM